MTTPTRKSPSSLPFIGFGVIAVTALLSLYVVGDPSGAGLAERIYRSIGIFTGSGGWAFDTTGPTPHANVLFRILAILAPVMTALGLTELATGATIPLWLRLVAFLRRQTRPATAIIGLTEDSLAFAATLRAERGLPLLYASVPDPALAQRATQLRLPVLPLPRRSAIVLPRRVTHAVSFLPTAGQQVDLAASLAPRPGRDLRVSLLMPDHGLAQRLDEYLKYAASHNGIHPQLIDQDALAARRLLARHPLDTLADAFGQDRIHLAIYGFGALGRAVAKQAARYYVTQHSLQGRPLRITVIDRAADPLRPLLAEDPGMAGIAVLDAVGGADLDPAGFTAADVLRVVPTGVTAHIMAMVNPQAAFALAVSLRRWLLEPPHTAPVDWPAAHRLAPVFVRTPDWSGLGRLLRSGVDHAAPAPPELPDGLFAFATRDDLLATATLLGQEREAGGMAVQAAYDPSAAGPPDPARAKRPAELAWSKLPPAFRESSMHAADHAAIKARAIGYRLMPLGAAPAGAWPAPAVAMRQLSELEHLRYVAERGADGWRYAETRADALRVHPDLVPFDELTLDEQTIDVRQAAALPAIAAAMGLRLAEAFIIGVVADQPDKPLHSIADWTKALRHLSFTHPTCAPVLLTTLAPGMPTHAAAAAKECGIPFVVPLPLPYELYKDEFPDDAALKVFHALVAQAEYYFELPVLCGRASDMGYARPRQKTPPGNLSRRAAQFAVANAYIHRCATGALPFA